MAKKNSKAPNYGAPVPQYGKIGVGGTGRYTPEGREMTAGEIAGQAPQQQRGMDYDPYNTTEYSQYFADDAYQQPQQPQIRTQAEYEASRQQPGGDQYQPQQQQYGQQQYGHQQQGKYWSPQGGYAQALNQMPGGDGYQYMAQRPEVIAAKNGQFGGGANAKGMNGMSLPNWNAASGMTPSANSPANHNPQGQIGDVGRQERQQRRGW